MFDAALFHRTFRRGACRVGAHGPYRVRLGMTPIESFRQCATCLKKWRGSYDGLEATWTPEPEAAGNQTASSDVDSGPTKRAGGA